MLRIARHHADWVPVAQLDGPPADAVGYCIALWLAAQEEGRTFLWVVDGVAERLGEAFRCFFEEPYAADGTREFHLCLEDSALVLTVPEHRITDLTAWHCTAATERSRS